MGDVITGRVLLVCDGIQEFLFYRGLLSDLGYEFVICSCYEEGARRVATEDFDFAIVNQGSASFEGRCVLERAAEMHRNIPIVVVTRCLDTHCYLEATDLGAVDYLERPAPDDLGCVLETELRRRSAV
jgi:DNA-binding NtrC family response regulator